MGSKSQKMEVVEYYMSLHYGIACGPIDEIRAIIINEKEAWSGSVSDYTDIAINKPDLFGGVKKEGGAVGTATYLPGNAAQVMPEFLANKLGLTSDTCPAYRGIASIFMTGGAGGGGFYWTANSPYIQGTWVVARRAPKVLNQSIAMIPDKDGKLSDANVAHVIYESMTNTDWGIGTPTAGINVQSFSDCAQTLYDEKFGISLLWVAQQSVEEFTSKLLGYVEGVIYVNPRDGLLTMKLIRGDYDEDDLPVIDPSNAKLSNFQRKLWGETVNEIVVSWTNPESEETETVSAQDLANIAIQGGVVSDSNEYEGVRNADLAMKLATRDLRVASYPLATCEAEVNREAWDIVPGSCVKVVWPQHGLDGVVMRVTNVDYGKIGDSKVRLALSEDVFALDTQDYVEPPASGWIDPSELPAPLVYSLVFTLPYYFARTMGDDTTLAALGEPQVLAGVLGAQPGQDTAEFILATMGSNSLGNPTVIKGTSLSITARATISTALVYEVTSVVSFSGKSQGDGLAAGGFAIMGTTDENMEICLITSVVGNVITMKRGMLDTTPKEWPVGTPIWFVAEDAVIDDETVYTAGQTVTYRPLTVTSRGTLLYADATEAEGEMTNRPWLPTRPADVKVAGQSTGIVNAISVANVNVTWKNRNRSTEDSILLDWDDASVSPESGQTTSIVILDPDTRAVLNRVDGLTGTSYSMSTGLVTTPTAILRIVATKDGKDSIQGHEILIMVSSGYGYSYGLNYGS